MQTTGLFGGLYVITEWMSRIAITNIIWLLFNIPIIFFVFNLLIFNTIEEMLFTGVVIIILLPIVFFPATTAMFALTRRWIIGERNIRVFRMYWKFYKENYLKSLLGGLIVVFIWILFFVDYYFFTFKINELFKYFFYGLFVYLSMFTINFFSNIVHFHTRLRTTFKNALLMTLKNPLLSLVLIVISAAVVLLSFSIATFLIPFFMGSSIAFLCFIGFYYVYLKEYNKEMADEKAEEID